VDNPREEGKKLSHPTQQSNTQNPNQSESGVTFLKAAAPTHHPNQRPNQMLCRNCHSAKVLTKINQTNPAPKPMSKPTPKTTI
jgi:hypothetical protein